MTAAFYYFCGLGSGVLLSFVVMWASEKIAGKAEQIPLPEVLDSDWAKFDAARTRKA